MLRAVFLFTAIVGQEEMKLALLLNVIDPKIGGVMIVEQRSSFDQNPADFLSKYQHEQDDTAVHAIMQYSRLGRRESETQL